MYAFVYTIYFFFVPQKGNYTKTRLSYSPMESKQQFTLLRIGLLPTKLSEPFRSPWGNAALPALPRNGLGILLSILIKLYRLSLAWNYILKWLKQTRNRMSVLIGPVTNLHDENVEKLLIEVKSEIVAKY